MRAGLAAVLLASGHSKRYGENKLLAPRADGSTMLEHAFSAVPPGIFSSVFVVTRFEPAAALAQSWGFIPVMNPDLSDDLAITIRMGVERLPSGTSGCMFMVCDQPNLRPETVARLAESFLRSPERIFALAADGRRGNPVIFPASLFNDLASLSSNLSGRALIMRHPDMLSTVEAPPAELLDVDRP